MLDTFKDGIANQFDATFCTLHTCIDRCPDATWDAPVINLAFCQVAFHTLFFADYYLSPTESLFRQQPFHLDNPHIFRNYEELEDRPPVLMYNKSSVTAYLHHCRNKATSVLTEETTASLQAPCGFPRKEYSRAELHISNVRHLQHHAGQLSMRLRIDANVEIPWIHSGWCDV